jgi:uncharacterized protein (TIGR02246 family)
LKELSMADEAQAIRETVAAWMRASKAGETEKVLQMMAEDVVFLRAGHEPMRGREGFAAASQGNAGMKVEGEAEVMEVEVRGDRAYSWTKLWVRVTPAGGEGREMRGYTMTVWKKEGEGKWVIWRDANMLAAGKNPA